MSKTRKIVILALLIALGVILSRFLSIQTPVLRIGFAFVALAAAGILYGPVYGGIVGGLIDIVGYLAFPDGAYFPGITLSGVLSGVTYGLFLHRKTPSLPRVTIASAISAFAISGLLTTYWLTIIIPGQTFVPLLLTRVLSTAVLFPVQIVVIFSVWKAMEKTRFLSFAHS